MDDSQYETPPVKKQNFFPFSTRRCLILQKDVNNDDNDKIEKKIGAAGIFCMDQSYFTFLFR